MEIKVFKKDKKIEIKRALKQALFGFMVSPYLHLQYNVIIPKLFPEIKRHSFVKSVAYAILISDAIFNCAFFLYMGYIKNRDFRKAYLELPEKFIPVQMTNIQVFPWLTGFNFYVISPKFRVLFDNFLSIFWNIYLSYVEHK
jgi:protein Mpv17